MNEDRSTIKYTRHCISRWGAVRHGGEGVGSKAKGEVKRDEREREAERWTERRDPVGEMEGREYRLNGRSALHDFSLSLSVL